MKYPNIDHDLSFHMNTSENDLQMERMAQLRSTDRLLPIANISKIMKKPIPKVAKIAKDAKEIMQKAASEFIAIVTCMAKEICESENRKTLTGEDLIRAMEQLGMPYYSQLGRIYLKRFKENGKIIGKSKKEDGMEQIEE
ncbi:hypothetical protein GVAV_002601 [Gurleya vavrai]